MVALTLMVMVGLASTGTASSESARVAQLKRIGHPAWKPVDFHLFSAPFGTAGDGYAEFVSTALSLLPAPNHVFHPALLVGPGAPHQPPYDRELAHGVANLGYHQGRHFKAAEFSNGTAVWLAWMNVPSPGDTGSSPDFASGTIIPNRLFPIAISGVAMHNGALFDPNLAGGSVPPLDSSLDPPFNVDGHSHFPMFVADNLDFGPVGTKAEGAYAYHVTLTDQQGHGWSIVARFSVSRR